VTVSRHTALVVQSSISRRGRARSLELGTIENPADPGEASGTSGMRVFSSLDETRVEPLNVMHIDLTNYGPEIHDIAIL